MDNSLLFHDQSEMFVKPIEPEAWDDVVIRFRTGAGEAHRVILVSDEREYAMKLERSDNGFDFYRAEISLGDVAFEYYFRVESSESDSVGEREAVYYDWRGVSNKKPAAREHMMFRIIPGFHVPGWARGAVMYQIFVDRFRNGDKSNDVLSHEYQYNGGHCVREDDWSSYPDTSEDFRHFYGGDLQGVLDKLDYLEGLGVDVIYFNPLFVSPSSHKYDTQDYDHIDPHFGRIVDDGGSVLADRETDNRKAERFIRRVTSRENLEASDSLFAEVVAEAHKRGIRVILDGVFNHCGSFNKWLDREQIYGNGAYESSDSPYVKWFDFRKKKWPYNATYDGWWGYDTLPKINYENSKALQEYILRVGRKWVSAPYNADGWRLDVATDLGHSEAFNHEFWRRFRDAVKDANPDAVILAENYGSSRNWLMGDEWDTIMNYDAFMEPITWFLTGEEKHSDEFRKDRFGNTALFWKSMTRAIGENFTRGSMSVAMNELSNHDHSRFLTRTNMTPGRCTDTAGSAVADEGVNYGIFREAVVFQMTWPGAPTIYYGDEAGVKGYTDPDNRRTYPWGREDTALIAFHRDMIRIHHECPEFTDGALVRLGSNRDRGILTFGRFTENTASVVILNNNKRVKELQLDVKSLGTPSDAVFEHIISTCENGYELDGRSIALNDWMLTISMEPYSAYVLRYTRENR